eukprot:TRINITY_DN56372_c0_g1_i1.p1 TRINITY_DN56372_c0_g1~~TRINITY_DN56372_c0_g1_i1.p1  ORF type:complete len:113 (+),score=5.53 TRINITY_DN56372_c0_g1_i1:150-488(+)
MDLLAGLVPTFYAGWYISLRIMGLEWQGLPPMFRLMVILLDIACAYLIGSYIFNIVTLCRTCCYDSSSFKVYEVNRKIQAVIQIILCIFMLMCTITKKEEKVTNSTATPPLG